MDIVDVRKSVKGNGLAPARETGFEAGNDEDFGGRGDELELDGDGVGVAFEGDKLPAVVSEALNGIHATDI